MTPPTARERREAALAHASALLVFFLPLGNLAGPLVFLFAGRRSAFVASHARQSVQFQAVVTLVAWTLFAMALMHGWKPTAHHAALLLPLLPSSIAAAVALAGKPFRYPLLPP